jgi:hypothetical protein
LLLHVPSSAPFSTLTCPPLHAQAGEKIVLEEDLAFKKKQQEEAKRLKEAAAKMKK